MRMWQKCGRNVAEMWQKLVTDADVAADVTDMARMWRGHPAAALARIAAICGRRFELWDSRRVEVRLGIWPLLPVLVEDAQQALTHR